MTNNVPKIHEVSTTEKIPSKSTEKNTTVEHNPIKYTGETVIEFIPNNETQFKQLLLQKKKARRTWIYKNGTSRTEIWDATNFKPSSNLKGNSQSTNHWRTRKETGLIKIIFEIL